MGIKIFKIPNPFQRPVAIPLKSNIINILVFRPFQLQQKEKTNSGYKHNSKVSHIFNLIFNLIYLSRFNKVTLDIGFLQKCNLFHFFPKFLDFKLSRREFQDTKACRRFAVATAGNTSAFAG